MSREEHNLGNRNGIDYLHNVVHYNKISILSRYETI